MLFRSKDPIQRGLYLCQLNGFEANLETNTAMPVQFLMKQMEWRETLDESATDLETLEELASEVDGARQEYLQELAESLEHSSYANAVDLLRGLMFIDKFASELDDAIAELA